MQWTWHDDDEGGFGGRLTLLGSDLEIDVLECDGHVLFLLESISEERVFGVVEAHTC